MAATKYVRAVRNGWFDLAGNGTAVELKAGTVFQVPASLKLTANSWIQVCDKDGELTDPDQLESKAKGLRAAAKVKKEAVDVAQAAYKAADALADAAERKHKDRVAEVAAEAKAAAAAPK